MRALGRRHPPDRARAAGGQGGQRLDPARRGEGALLPAAQRGLRAAAGRGGGAARGARRRAGGGGGGRPAARLLGRARPLRLALPRRRHRARRGALPAPPAHRAEQGDGDPAGRLGPVERPARAPRGRRARSATSTPTSSSTTTSATSASGWRRPATRPSSSPPPRRSTTTSSPPTSRPGCRGSSNSTAIATSTCASTTRAPAALAVRLLTAWSYALRALAAAVHPRPTGPRLPGPRPPGALPGPRREHPRSAAASAVDAIASTSVNSVAGVFVDPHGLVGLRDLAVDGGRAAGSPRAGARAARAGGAAARASGAPRR